MKKLDQYIVKNFLGPFFAVLLVVEFILMMQFLWVYIDELVGKGLSFKIIGEFMLWGGCTMLPLAMPLAVLLTSVMCLGQMAENTELVAIKASGISLARVMAPMAILAVLISIAAFFAANNLVPTSFNKIYTLRDDIKKTKDEINIPTGTFYDGIDGYILRVESKNKKTGMMYDVMIYDHGEGKTNLVSTLADSAMIRMSKEKDFIVFDLYDGVNYNETNVMKYRDTTLQLQRVAFKSQEMIIPLENYAFQKSSSARYGDQVRAMPISQLRAGADSSKASLDSAWAVHRQEFVDDRALTFNTQLDTASHFEAKTAIEYPKVLTWENESQEINAYREAVNIANAYKMRMTNNANEVYEFDWLYTRSRVEWLKKYAGALACLIMFLIGAPLGSFVTRKGGLGSGIIIAVLFFVLYWVVDITGVKLARDGAVPPWLGVFVSSVVLLPMGVFLSSRAIHDSALFRTENFGAWFRKAKSNVMNIIKKPRIVYMGTPEFAVAPLDALVGAGYKVAGVVTVADKPSGRGLKMTESPVKKYATEHGIPVLQPEKLKDPAFLGQLAALGGDIFVVVGFRMLPEEVWGMPKLGTFNLHTALLPQYRGAAPVNWAVINGERMTGVTTFMIDKNIDTGGIILRQECSIDPEDTAGDVEEKLKPIGSQIVLETVQGIIERAIETRTQRSFIQGSEVLHPAPKLSKELCHIDWDDTTKQVHNLIRGLSPAPTAYTELVREGSDPAQLKVYKSARVFGPDFDSLLSRLGMPEGSRPAPGTVLTDGKKVFAVATRDGAVSLLDVQLQGKKRMDIKSFLAGFRDAASYSTTKGTSSAEIAKTRS